MFMTEIEKDKGKRTFHFLKSQNGNKIKNCMHVCAYVQKKVSKMISLLLMKVN